MSTYLRWLIPSAMVVVAFCMVDSIVRGLWPILTWQCACMAAFVSIYYADQQIHALKMLLDWEKLKSAGVIDDAGRPK